MDYLRHQTQAFLLSGSGSSWIWTWVTPSRALLLDRQEPEPGGLLSMQLKRFVSLGRHLFFWLAWQGLAKSSTKFWPASIRAFMDSTNWCISSLVSQVSLTLLLGRPRPSPSAAAVTVNFLVSLEREGRESLMKSEHCSNWTNPGVG